MVDGKKFYDQPINDKMEQYDEVRKVSTGKGHDYTTTCLLNYAYFKDNYRLIVVNLSNKKSFRCWSKSNSTNSISRSCWRSW